MAERRCSIHLGYKTARPPTADCITCWAAYGRRRSIDDGLRSQGKLKGGGGRASKAKGRSAVLLIKQLMHEIAPWLEDDDILVKATSMGGVDLHLSPRAAEWCPFAIESKNVEALNIWAALKQAADNADGKPPIVFFKRAGTQLYVALSAETLLNLLPKPTWLNPNQIPPFPVEPSPPAPTL